MNTVAQILDHKIIAIIRGVEPKNVLPVVESLYAGGIRIAEITLNSEMALELLGELSLKMKDKMLIGAGTVMDLKSAKKAIKQGARFIISPSMDLEVIQYVREKGTVMIPGAFTTTEIVTAYKAGADIIKVFPAPGPQYIKDLRGPIPYIPLMPTGGVDLTNLAAYQKAGAVAFGIGGSLVHANFQITEDSLKQLTLKAEQFVQVLKMN